MDYAGTNAARVTTGMAIATLLLEAGSLCQPGTARRALLGGTVTK